LIGGFYLAKKFGQWSDDCALSIRQTKDDCDWAVLSDSFAGLRVGLAKHTMQIIVRRVPVSGPGRRDFYRCRILIVVLFNQPFHAETARRYARVPVEGNTGACRSILHESSVEDDFETAELALRDMMIRTTDMVDTRLERSIVYADRATQVDFWMKIISFYMVRTRKVSKMMSKIHPSQSI
jgi:hypothetical protein